MSSPAEGSRGSLQARVTIGEDASVTTTLLTAAEEAGIDVIDCPTKLHDVVDGDALDRLFSNRASGSTEPACTVVLRLWGRTFLVTPDAVAVHD